MSELTTTHQSDPVKEALKRSSGFRRGLHKVFPGVIEARITRDLETQRRIEEEKHRREELGPKGRIQEDARNAVEASALRSYLENARKSHNQGERNPIGEYPNSYTSYLRTTSRYLAEKGESRKNFLGQRFGFAVGMTEDFEVGRGPDELAEVFLIGTNDKLKITKSYKLDDEFLDSLSEPDLAFLETAASDIYDQSEKAAFNDFMDRHI